MLALVAAIGMIPASYGLQKGAVLLYDLTVRLDGHLPLLGGEKATAEVSLVLKVAGAEPSPTGKPRATTEIIDVKITMNGAALPFGLDSVRAYFPKVTVTLDPLGRVLESDAPDIQLPVQLPGFDLKRLPELTWLPIEFPKDGIEPGSSFGFERKLENGPMSFRVNTKEVSDGLASLAVESSQTYYALESATGELVTIESEAARRTHTSISALGEVKFDLAKGAVRQMTVRADAATHVTPVLGGDSTERRLATLYTLKLRT
jgi:hypothetical protein